VAGLSVVKLLTLKNDGWFFSYLANSRRGRTTIPTRRQKSGDPRVLVEPKGSAGGSYLEKAGECRKGLLVQVKGRSTIPHKLVMKEQAG